MNNLELIEKLNELKDIHGELPIRFFVDNDDRNTDYCYSLHESVISIEVVHIHQIDERVYVKEDDYEELIEDLVDGYCYVPGEKITREEVIEKTKKYVENLEWKKVIMIWTAG